MKVVDGLGLEFRRARGLEDVQVILEEDPELVAQAMEQPPEVLTGVWCLVRRIIACDETVHAGDPGAVLAVASVVRSCCCDPASRHSVSAKILIEPPAVRTYSTLPAEIQL